MSVDGATLEIAEGSITALTGTFFGLDLFPRSAVGSVSFDPTVGINGQQSQYDDANN